MKSLKNKKIDRMEFGFNSVREVKDEDFAAAFRSHIKNIPMYINVNGLLPTLAFIMTKANKSGKDIKDTKDTKDTKDKKLSTEAKSYRYIGEILINYFYMFNLISDDAKSKIAYKDVISDLECLVEDLFSDKSDYRRITLEVLSMLEWMVKFADGMIERSKDEAVD